MPSGILELLEHRSSVRIEKILDSGDAAVTFLNSFSYLYFRNRPGLLREFDYILVDGASLRYIINLTSVSRCRRVSFDYSSIAGMVFEYAQKRRMRLAIIGSEPDYLGQALANIMERYPDLNIAYSRDGYFTSNAAIDDAIDGIIAAKADIVIVGMGSGKQERFLNRLRLAGWRGLGLTCGGFIHQAAESLDYYPEIIRKYGLRWLYRLIKEPLKVGRRLLFSYSPFLLFYAVDWIEWMWAKRPGAHNAESRKGVEDA